MKKVFPIFCVFLLYPMFFFVPQICAQEKYYSVSGFVTNKAGAGVSGVEITISGKVQDSRYTDPTGYYFFDGIPNEAKIEISAKKENFTLSPSIFKISSINSNRTINFKAAKIVSKKTEKSETPSAADLKKTDSEKPLYEIKGKINYYASGLSGVKVSINADKNLVALTDVNGNYSIKDFTPTGKNVLTFSKEGYRFNPEETDLSHITQDFTVNAEAIIETFKISGVVSEGKNFIKGVSVKITNGIEEFNGTTDEKGYYEIGKLPYGNNFLIIASKEGVVITPLKVVVNKLISDKTANFNANVRKFKVSGFVTDDNDEPVKKANVILRMPEESITAETDSNGFYEFNSVPSFLYLTLQAVKSGYEDSNEQNMRPLTANEICDFRIISLAPSKPKKNVVVVDSENTASKNKKAAVERERLEREEKEAREAKIKQEQEDKERAEKEKEKKEREKRLKEEKDRQAREEKEAREAKIKQEQEDKERAEKEKEKKEREKRLKEEKELEIREEKLRRGREEKEAREARIKQKREEKERKAEEARIEKEAKEAKLRSDKEEKERQQEARLKTEREKAEAEREEENRKAIERKEKIQREQQLKEDKERQAKEEKEARKAKIKQEQEDRERAEKEKEDKERQAKEEKEARKAKIKQEQEDRERAEKEREDKERQDREEKEARESKIKQKKVSETKNKEKPAIKESGKKVKTVKIKGTIAGKYSAAAGVELTVEPGGYKTETDEKGKYSFDDIPENSRYVVKPRSSDILFEPESAVFEDVKSNITQDFTPYIAIEGETFFEGKHISDVSVFLNDSKMTETNQFGKFKIYPVEYNAPANIRVSQEGYSFYPLIFTLKKADKNYDGVNFFVHYSISGKITMAGTNSGLSNAEIEIRGSSRTTIMSDFAGNFSIQGLEAAGSYKITPKMGGYTFTPPSRDYVSLRENFISQNFTAAKETFDISGSVTLGGKPVKTAVVSITRRALKYFTNDDGYFEIKGLDYGKSYVITVQS
ncbi:MAG: carboxypeptidase regulatory-like domain-containing protein, partial [Endomicrobium sp.]|nr:carboxypeptidase regulatory-like domain-containing protein [Endomicrobium sp.]